MCNNCGSEKCAGCKGCGMNMVIKILLIIGGLNWGLQGVGMLMGTNLNIVNLILGSWSTIEAIIYIVVGIAAVMKIFGGCPCKKCQACKVGAAPAGDMAKPM